jgi:DNA helicase IV
MQKSKVYESENEYKERIYKTFEKMREKGRNDVARAQKNIDAGRYEDQDAFTVYNDRSDAWNRKHRDERIVQKLYLKPYFAHVRVRETGLGGQNEDAHYFLSDCESLDSAVSVDAGVIVPFKQDKQRPITGALFSCYQRKNGKGVTYKVGDNSITLIPDFICDDEIENRILRNAVQLFPIVDDVEEYIDADELLEDRLRENRDNPTLQNIISTLQRQQFEIISADLEESFAVQGCAGSGKSQCLLHRLFFLRDELSEDGWEHTLLLTPTQLFRNYSAELVKRYQLTDVDNCSIAELYRTLLSIYDERFRSRQYQFELSEEYLPDEYLQGVYEPKNITKIENEIDIAIRKYVESGCSAIGEIVPDKITAGYISDLVKKLDSEMEAYDAREQLLQMDDEYNTKRAEYEALQKKYDTAQKALNRLLEEEKTLDREVSDFDKCVIDLQDAIQEREEWLKVRQSRIQTARKNLSIAEKASDDSEDILFAAKYAQRLYELLDLTKGDTFQSDEDYLKDLDWLCKEFEDAVKKASSEEDVNNTIQKNDKRKKDLTTRINKRTEEMDVLSKDIEKYTVWLKNKVEELEGEESKKTLRRAEMERARYFLSRIESTVFEQEVWNALAPEKEKYGIKTLQVDEIENTNRKKETRILYKSDLLFYIKIYARLHPNAFIPKYRLICVDEGQDLHKADYDILHSLFPDAVLNVFGDTKQVLHTACGIHDWETEAGVGKVYSMNRNYRNTAAIVDFCNRSFKEKMDYVGKVRENQKPKTISTMSQFRECIRKDKNVLIVKNRDKFRKLCELLDMEENDFDFLDTNAVEPSGKGIPCYTVFSAKGLEFPSVSVYAEDMTLNQKVVSCTRAMADLYYYG